MGILNEKRCKSYLKKTATIYYFKRYLKKTATIYDFKKSPPYNYYLKDIPKRYILDKYFTSDKIEEIKHFEIFNDTEILEIIDLLTYKPITFGALNFHNVV